MINRFERFSYDICEVSRYWHKLANEEMELHGLKGPQAVYFTALYRFPEGLTAGRLSEICAKDKSDVSRAIALCQSKGFVTKENLNNSSYRAPIKLTEKGKKVAEHIAAKAVLAVESASEGLTMDELKTFYKAFELIGSNLRKYAESGEE